MANSQAIRLSVLVEIGIPELDPDLVSFDKRCTTINHAKTKVEIIGIPK